MTIELITPEQYEVLLDIQKEHPALTLQNDGYQYINKSKLTKDDTEAFEKVTKILKEHIIGFSKFNNFRLAKKTNIIELRFQYSWTVDDDESTTSFTGVGYLPVEHLYKGFPDN